MLVKYWVGGTDAGHPPRDTNSVLDGENAVPDAVRVPSTNNDSTSSRLGMFIRPNESPVLVIWMETP